MINKRKAGFSVLLMLVLLGGLLDAENVEAGDARIQEKLVELEKSVSASKTRKIEFTEERFFSFRKKPIEVRGVLRLWNGVGVSISYPKKRTLLIADGSGVLVRKFRKNGSFRQRSIDVEKMDTIRLLKAVFEFDRAELERLFDLKWREKEGQWSIIMMPRDKDEEEIEMVIMTGRELVVERIDLAFSDKKKIVIHPLKERLKAEFSEEEEAKYFRNSTD